VGKGGWFGYPASKETKKRETRKKKPCTPIKRAGFRQRTGGRKEKPRTRVKRGFGGGGEVPKLKNETATEVELEKRIFDGRGGRGYRLKERAEERNGQ